MDTILFNFKKYFLKKPHSITSLRMCQFTGGERDETETVSKCVLKTSISMSAWTGPRAHWACLLNQPDGNYLYDFRRNGPGKKIIRFFPFPFFFAPAKINQGNKSVQGGKSIIILQLAVHQNLHLAKENSDNLKKLND